MKKNKKKRVRMYPRFTFKVDLPKTPKIEMEGNIYEKDDLKKIGAVIQMFHGDNGLEAVDLDGEGKYKQRRRKSVS